MSRLPLLIAAAALGSSATAPPEPARSSQAEAQFQQLLAGKVPQAPVSCMPGHGYNGMVVIDENTIAFRTGAHRVYVSHMRRGCSGLGGPSSYILVTRQLGPSGFCEGDIADVVDPLNHFTVGTCVFGEFTPYARSR